VDPATRGLNELFGLEVALRRNVCTRNHCALGSKAQSGFPTKATARAGYKDNLVLKPLH
jgi:hypothetical protein